MVKAHLLIPEDQENIMYTWLINFQYVTEYYYEMYKDSKEIEDESDIYIFSDPTWSHPDHPLGLTFFDPENNCAAILGMRYFGEHKKGTLTLAWGIANRHGYAACHGGKYDITVLHDDAFIISTEDRSSVALEPAYFDKTQDYPMEDPDNTFLVTVQNNGATLDEDGKIVLVTEDTRNGNGRAVKSKLWSPNRKNKFPEPANAIMWLMKDPTLPPVLKITDPTIAAAMGATLATKRTSAERLAEGVDPNALVVEPYANPFRTYRLKNDYAVFKELFEKSGVECYIFNTGHFMDKKVTVEATLGSIEAIVEGKATFDEIGIDGISVLNIDGYDMDFSDAAYKEQFVARINDRVAFIESKDTARGGYDKLPKEALQSMKAIAEQAKKL